jgi:2-polyprenyl-3-methyl-5-hydroxy-6-metoxy-1,4-benzoquinol methylase
MKEKLTFRPKCMLCSSQKICLLYFKFGRFIAKCKKCGLGFAFPQPPKENMLARYESPLFFNNYLKTFHATYKEYDLQFIEKHYRIYLDLLRKIYFSGARLLDVGCGAGFFLKAAIKEGWQGEGIEISSLAANYAENIVKIPVHRGSLESLSIPYESYDLITMLDLLEHLSHPLETLKMAYRLLKKGGHIFASTPDFHSLSRIFLGKSWAVLSPSEHLFYFTSRSLYYLFKFSGFKIKGIYNLLIFNPAYFHGYPKLRNKLWSIVHSWLEKQVFMEKLHGIEYLELMKLAGSPIPTSNLNLRQKIIRRLYRKMKTLLHGDILCILAQK